MPIYGLAADDVVEGEVDAGYQDDHGDEEPDDEPGGHSELSGLRLGDAEGIDEGAGEESDEVHTVMDVMVVPFDGRIL